MRLLFASLLGACVGKERSMTHKHSAGVRTMALVALGAAAFTVCSSFGFNALAAGRCDPSRMASNVASGVGFVGAGVITTSTGANPNDSRQSIVHGLTTATAIWISAAIGVACGVGMFYIATAATLTTIAILKFGVLKQEVLVAKSFRGKKASSELHIQRQTIRDHVKLKNMSVEPFPLTGLSSKKKSLVTSTAVSQEEINREDGWDSHTEVVEVDKDVAEFHQVGQADILEKAQAAARGANNLTGISSKSKKRGEGGSFRGAADDYFEPVPVRTSLSDFPSNRGNETLGP
jgi:putative Mg2+ transporter-C (MgtC) family protein